MLFPASGRLRDTAAVWRGVGSFAGAEQRDDAAPAGWGAFTHPGVRSVAPTPLLSGGLIPPGRATFFPGMIDWHLVRTPPSEVGEEGPKLAYPKEVLETFFPFELTVKTNRFWVTDDEGGGHRK